MSPSIPKIPSAVPRVAHTPPPSSGGVPPHQCRRLQLRRRGSPSLTNASMHLRLNPLDEKRYAQITETRFVFPDVLFFYLANYVPESSRSTEHYPTRRKVCIRQDTVGQDACPILMKGIDLRHETQLGARTRETLDRFFKIRGVRRESSTRYILADASRGIGIVVSFAAWKRTARVRRRMAPLA
jgi:hypothetical protein